MTEQQLMTDFPKIYCPYVRKIFKVDKNDFKKNGGIYKMRDPEAYLVINKVNPGYEWVFDDPETIAVEKLDGTNIKIKTENGRIIAVQNRMNVIDPLKVVGGPVHLIDGILRSAAKGLIQSDGEFFGELIGPKLQSNPYKLTDHEWYPFEKAIGDLRYKSFHEHERTFENLSSWFQNHLHSRYFTKRATKLGLDEKIFSEGVIFYNLKRKSENKSWRAKLRRDMFDWYYSPGVKIFDYDANSDFNDEDLKQQDIKD
jgi:hypothetical protein